MRAAVQKQGPGGQQQLVARPPATQFNPPPYSQSSQYPQRVYQPVTSGAQMVQTQPMR
jgi:hypothetical protein